MTSISLENASGPSKYDHTFHQCIGFKPLFKSLNPLSLVKENSFTKCKSVNISWV